METSRTAAVVVASTSAAAGTAEDKTGQLITRWLSERGFETGEPTVVADGQPVRFAVDDLLANDAQVVIVTGGTGVSPDDQSPEMVAPLLDVQLPGIIEAIRRRGEATTALSIITRGVAGFSGNSFVITLPGSTGGVKDGLAVLDPILEHLLVQRSGITGHGPR
ncbi:MogA/MoaB family molybdenum cofactor biosynthesis protein [Glutamicibacter arilaitensis]|uniref:MogA/MoaB family molybdenum cofactor biosynthesis protein n=1 Tax=Glutamicibacter arilaitensis TaxID=256701 RepID=UPI003FD6BE73